MAGRSNGRQEKGKIRYAVVGLGYFAQMSILPAFAHAGKNSELAALISGDKTKLKKLSAKYGVEYQGSYDKFEDCLKKANVDAIYLATPNSLHREYTVRAARAGVHVLCEKPMAVTEEECEEMIHACDKNKVKLMIAYRLHFEKGNLSAAEVVRSGKLGAPRIFNSIFTMQVRDKNNIRIRREMGGGAVYDIGVYCINAARYIFASEPIEVSAMTANNGESRFSEVEEMASVLMRFPDDRLASFICSFGGADAGSYEVIGTAGTLRMNPAYESAEELKQAVTIKGKKRKRAFPKRDQVAPEILYFSDCILNDREPEPSGHEGLIDVRIVRAIYQSAQTGKPIKLQLNGRDRYPDPRQEIRRPPAKKPDLVKAVPPSGKKE
jgi:glucose-fructose oxidoreductase